MRHDYAGSPDRSSALANARERRTQALKLAERLLSLPMHTYNAQKRFSAPSSQVRMIWITGLVEQRPPDNAGPGQARKPPPLPMRPSK